MVDRGILDSVSDYHYGETVFVAGNVQRYVVDLEGYFRRDLSHLDNELSVLERDIGKVESQMRLYNKLGVKFTIYGGDPRTISWCLPFPITESNFEEGMDWFETEREFFRALIKSQRINHSSLRQILEDPKKISSLDLTNYHKPDAIVRIQHSPGPTIRMRVFYNGKEDRTQGGGFAMHANGFEGVVAEVRHEADVQSDLKTLQSFLDSEEVKKSRLRVRPLKSRVESTRGGMKYTIQLSGAELEMLRLLKQERYERAKHLCFNSPHWSQEQGWKILRNLYGVVSVYHGEKRRTYYELSIPEENAEAVAEAIANGGAFIKTVRKASLPVLAKVFERTLELRDKYGWSFYPRFSVVEVSNRASLEPKKVEAALVNLTGVLCHAEMPFSFTRGEGTESNFHVLCNVSKWFIPKTGLPIAYQMLHANGLA